MKFTTPDSIPYPESGDDFAPLEQWLRDIATATQAALAQDTGWLAIVPTRSGVTSNRDEPARVRYKRGQVTFLGQFDYSGSPGNGVFATLPDAIPRPPFRVIVPTYNTTRSIVNPDGTLAINLGTSSNSYARIDGITYPA